MSQHPRSSDCKRVSVHGADDLVDIAQCITSAHFSCEMAVVSVALWLGPGDIHSFCRALERHRIWHPKDLALPGDEWIDNVTTLGPTNAKALIHAIRKVYGRCSFLCMARSGMYGLPQCAAPPHSGRRSRKRKVMMTSASD